MNARIVSRLVSCCALLLAPPLWAAGAVVAEGLGIKITTDDLNADAQRLPAAARPQALSRPDAVQQTASNIFIRRALAADAEREGLATDPVVAATLQLARDRILSDAKLAKIDAAAKPSAETVERAARAAYLANPGKFNTKAQTRVRHILLSGNTDRAKASADKVLSELKAGADFEKYARELSTDVASAVEGGDLGYFESGQMLPEFEQAVDALKNPGDISELVRTQFGWHIIKLEGRRPAGQRTYEEVAKDLQRVVTGQLQSDARLAEATRLAGSAKFNTEAIEAFSAGYRK